MKIILTLFCRNNEDVNCAMTKKDDLGSNMGNCYGGVLAAGRSNAPSLDFEQFWEVKGF